MMPPDWDDERLGAAFHARFDRPAPRSVAPAIHDAIVGTAPARPGPFARLTPLTVAAAAVLVAIVAGAAVIGLGGFGPVGSVAPSAGPSGTADAATPTPDVDFTPTTPESVLGLDVIGISDALAIRDAGVDDRELAVAGWFTPAPPVSCPAPPVPPVSPVQSRCPDEAVTLTEARESLWTFTKNSMSGRSAVSPVLNPDLDDLDRSWMPSLPMGMDGESQPAHVVFLGHFDDRRSLLCPADEVTSCRDRFVLDQVAWTDGSTPPPSRVNLLDPGTSMRSSIAEIEAIVAEEAPQSPILSTVIVDGDVGLRTVEPALGTGRRGLIDQPILWIVRVLESERISTYVVVDGTNAIFEMTEDGDAAPVGGSLGPPPTPIPWPPAGAPIIELTSQVGAGEPPVQVAVVDLSGRLVGVREKGSLDLDVTLGPDGVGAYPEPGFPGRVHLVWIGGVCDSRIVVTVAADLRSISMDEGPQPPCDAMGVGREVVLDFSGAVDVPAIELLRNATAPAAVPSWAPAGSVVVELESEVGSPPPSPQAAIVDLSGRLLGVAKDGAKPVDAMVGADGIGIFAEAGKPGRVHLVWNSDLCYDRFIVTVAADMRAVVVDGKRDKPCHLVLAIRELVLDFSGTVDLAEIQPSLTVTTTIID